MPIFTLALKDLRLLLRDTRSAVILLIMPLVFILVLGLSLDEGFGQKPDDRLRVVIVNLDHGRRDVALREAVTPLLLTGQFDSGLGTTALWFTNRAFIPPAEPWADVVKRDLDET